MMRTQLLQLLHRRYRLRADIQRRRVHERATAEPSHAHERGTFWHLDSFVRRRESLMKMDGADEDSGVTDGAWGTACCSSALALAAQLEISARHTS
jgi:hypothetical protein